LIMTEETWDNEETSKIPEKVSFVFENQRK
jgi:hypothetical protein